MSLASFQMDSGLVKFPLILLQAKAVSMSYLKNPDLSEWDNEFPLILLQAKAVRLFQMIL